MLRYRCVLDEDGDLVVAPAKIQLVDLALVAGYPRIVCYIVERDKDVE